VMIHGCTPGALIILCTCFRNFPVLNRLLMKILPVGKGPRKGLRSPSQRPITEDSVAGTNAFSVPKLGPKVPTMKDSKTLSAMFLSVFQTGPSTLLLLRFFRYLKTATCALVWGFSACRPTPPGCWRLLSSEQQRCAARAGSMGGWRSGLTPRMEGGQ
jgi:hypothetical protein